MPKVARELLQTWTRSFEEDEGDVHVYRPASYGFPRQRRPRDGMIGTDSALCHKWWDGANWALTIRFDSTPLGMTAYLLSRARCSLRNLATLGAITIWQ
jgi:hypothetical protein